MGLLINQGKHNTSKDAFAPIVEDNVTLVISELKLAVGLTDTIEVTMRILSGANKNKFVYDRVNYNPDSAFSWKYRQLRKCAGVPYQEKEPESIDIEQLLLNRVVTADLKIRKGKNSEGEERDYQAINYKVSKIEIPLSETVEFDTEEEINAKINEAVKKIEPKETPEVIHKPSVTSSEEFDDEGWD